MQRIRIPNTLEQDKEKAMIQFTAIMNYYKTQFDIEVGIEESDNHPACITLFDEPAIFVEKWSDISAMSLFMLSILKFFKNVEYLDEIVSDGSTPKVSDIVEMTAFLFEARDEAISHGACYGYK